MLARPDIVLIVADDLPRNILGSYGPQHGLLPQIDSIGRDGTILTQAYTVAPLCTPSRYALLTGTYASRAARRRSEPDTSVARQVDFQVFLEHKKYKRPTRTLARMLSSVGFETAFLGKYHVGRSLQPSDCGHTSVSDASPVGGGPFVRASLLNDSSERAELSCQTIGNQSCLSASIGELAGFAHVADVYYDNDGLTFYAHQPEWMAHEAVRFVRSARRSRRNFFLWMAPSLTHSPSDLIHQLQSEPRAAQAGCSEEPHDQDAASFRESSRSIRTQVLARLVKAKMICHRNATDYRICPDDKLPPLSTLIHAEGFLPAEWFAGGGKVGEGRRAALATSVGLAAWLDASLATLFTELQAGDKNNSSTLTIFTADHGPYFAGKGHAFEAGIRVPLLMHWANGPWPAQRLLNKRVTHLDLLPTLASVVGMQPSPLTKGDGQDFSSALQSSQQQWQQQQQPDLFIEVGFSRTIVHEGYKLMLHLLPAEAAADTQCRSIHGLKVPATRSSNESAASAKANKIKFIYDVRERHPVHHCDKVQLYDMTADPAEQRNLALEQPERVASLRALLMRHVEAIESNGNADAGTTEAGAAKIGTPPKASSLNHQRQAREAATQKTGTTTSQRTSTKQSQQPRSWCQTCHPSTVCDAWPAESASAPAMVESPQLDDTLAKLIRSHAETLVAAMRGNASAHAVNQMLRLGHDTKPYAPRDKCVLLRASRGRLFIDFLRTNYAEQHDFSIASCFPSRKGNFLRSRMHIALRLIVRVLRDVPDLPDFDIGFCPDDCSPALSSDERGVMPALTSVHCAGRSSLPFVAWTVNSNRATDLSEWDPFIDEWARKARTVPWAERAAKAVFRGHLRPFTVCGDWPTWPPRYNEVIDASNWRRLGRSAIWSARIRHPELLDVNFDNRAEMASLWKLEDAESAAADEPTSISMEEQARRFRYVIHPEGQCGFADRLKTIMALPVLVFKQANPCAEWYEGLLVPGQHYAPVDGSYANLSAAIEWARAHDGEAQRIAARGHERVRQVVSLRGIYVYVEQLIRSYASAFAVHSPSSGALDMNFTHEFQCSYWGATTECALSRV